MLTRRVLTRLLPFLALPLRGFSGAQRPKYTVPPMLWFENEAGEKFIPSREQLMDMAGMPEGFKYQHTQFPCDLHHSVCAHEGGQVAQGTAGWSEDLVLEMAKSGDYKLSEAILIVANLCERCTNATAHDYGLKWGYRRHSDRWTRSGTECEFCRA